MRKCVVFLLAILLLLGLSSCDKKETVEVLDDPAAVATENVTGQTEVKETDPNLEEDFFDFEDMEETEPTEGSGPQTESAPEETEPKETVKETTAPDQEQPKETKPVQPAETTKPTKPAESTEPTTAPTTPAKPEPKSDYEKFLEMTPAQQQDFMESFTSMEAFFAWYTPEKQKYDAEHPPVEIDGESIDLGKLGF